MGTHRRQYYSMYHLQKTLPKHSWVLFPTHPLLIFTTTATTLIYDTSYTSVMSAFHNNVYIVYLTDAPIWLFEKVIFDNCTPFRL